MKKLLLITTALAVGFAGPAHAGPVAAAVAWVGGTGLAASGLAAAAIRFIGGYALNAIAGKLIAGQQQGAPINVSFDVKMGDDLPLSFVAGDYATAGKRKYMASWGPNTRDIVEVIEISAMPQAFGRFWVNDELGIIDTTQTVVRRGQNVGWPVENNGSGPGNPNIWVKWYDGTQTVADPYLVSVFGDDEDYPWTNAMVGRGKTYAVVTSCYHAEDQTEYPTFLWQPAPLPLYDWRYDSTNGGSGPQRWGNRATYEPTLNPAVIAYNIVRGIYYGDEWVFGGKNLAAWRLPVAEWSAAANACDQDINLSVGGVQPRYRCGMEISVDMEPASVLDEIGKSANMKFAEVGGRLKPIVDLPGAAVFAFTDGDILITEGQSFSPFYPASETFNAISATYPERGEKWASKDAPEYIDTDAQEDDGEYLPTSMSYGAVPFGNQVQRLMRSQMRDFRRMRRHQFYLPPDAYALEPGIDMVSWTSNRNGYINKQFMVESVSKTPGMNVLVSLREVDPSDYDWSSDFERPIVITPPLNPRPFVQTAEGFNVAPSTIVDEASNARRPDVLATYVGDQVGITSIQIRARVLGRSELVVDTLRRWNTAQTWRSFNVLPSTAYEFQARLYSDLTPRGAWSPWRTVTTPDVGFTWEDWDEALREEIEGELALIPAAVEAAEDARDRADAVRADHDALVEGFVGKLTDLSAADQGIQQRVDLLELSVNNSSYIRKTDGDGPSVGLWEPLGAATAPTSSTSVPPGQTGNSIQVTAPGAFEGPAYTGASLNGSIFRIRGWVFVSAGATARAALVNASGATIAQSAPITGGWQQIDQQFEIGVDTTEWSPAWLVTAGGTMRFWRVRLEDYSAAANLEASIAENARAIIDEQTARVASVGTLTARANSLAGRIFPSDMRNNAEFWRQSLSGDPAILSPLHPSVEYLNGPLAGAHIRIPAAISTNIHVASQAASEYIAGKVIRITARVRMDGGAPTNRLRVVIATMAENWSSVRSLATNLSISPTVASTWQTVVVDYTLPAAVENEVYFRAGVFANAAVTPARDIFIASILIDDITAAEGVRGQLSGEITSIKGLDVNALNGTAFGVLLDQLEVNAGGTSAKITEQGSAISDLEGNASAGYLIRAQAGGAVSFIDLIAADGSGQTPTSIARVGADQILLEGSVFADQLAVVGVPTLVHDPLYKRLGSWVGLAAGVTLNTVAATSTGTGVSFWGGETLLQINSATTGYARVISRKVAVKAGNRIKIEVPARSMSAGRYAVVRAFFFASEGQSSGSPTAVFPSNAVGGTASLATIEVNVPSDCAWVALELASAPNTTGATSGSAWFGYPEMRNMDAANLIVSGGIVADMITADTMRALNGRFSSLAAANVSIGNAEIATANIQDLSVSRLKIANDSVTTFPYAYTQGAQRVTQTQDSSSWATIQTLTFSRGRNSPMPIYYRTDVSAGAGFNDAGQIRLLRNGAAFRQNFITRPGNSGAASNGPNEFTCLDVGTEIGPVTFTLQAQRNPATSNSFIDLTNSFIGVLNAYK